jgi:hypothetical protein
VKKMKKPVMTFKKWSGILIVSALLLLLIPSSQTTMVRAIPPGPDFFYGTLNLDGLPAPAGITVTAKVDGNICGSITTQADGIYATFQDPLLVQSTSSIYSKTISFYANGAKCNETATFVEWREPPLQLNLTSVVPYTSDWDPARGASGVPVDTNISVHVRDDGSGVKQSTIIMKVGTNPNNLQTVIPVITETSHNYTLTYNPPTDFSFGQVVYVTIDASDLASTPHVMTMDSYSFTTGSDTVPPYTSNWYPAKGSTGVLASTNIVVHVKDDGIGVNQSTIKLKVNGNQVTPSITGEATDYTVTYDPPSDFGYAQVINVTIEAKDLASLPNTMQPDSCSFTTIADGTPPYTSNWYPTKNATDVPVNIGITLRIRDVMSGVDRSSIEMRVGTNPAGLPIVTPTITGTAANYTLTYVPPSSFRNGQVVYVWVAAEDFAGNPMADSYSFTTVGSSTITDATPPYTSGWSPAKNATGAAVNTNIVVHVLDSGAAGVDFSTIVMKVNDEDVACAITGTSANYTVTYDPPSDFGYGQTVNVTVDALDLSNPPNAMTTDSYSFTTYIDTAPPYTSGWNPAKNSTLVSAYTSIVVHVKDDQAGVKQNTIIMKVNGSPVTPAITGTSTDYTLTYTPPSIFGYGQLINVVVDAQDQASPPNIMTIDSYSFTVIELSSLEPIKGSIYEVKGLVLPGVTVKLIKNGVEKGTMESDSEGKYNFIIQETGDYILRASIPGFRTVERPVSITEMGKEYTLNCKGLTGIIPNAPSMWYLLDCAALWKYPPADAGCGLDIWTLLNVAAAWKYPLP